MVPCRSEPSTLHFLILLEMDNKRKLGFVCCLTESNFIFRESLIELIVARVGLERFCDSLACVTKHDLYSKAFQRSQPVGDSASNMLFDHNFTKLFKNLEGKNYRLCML